jgi:hypothetical protein
VVTPDTSREINPILAEYLELAAGYRGELLMWYYGTYNGVKVVLFGETEWLDAAEFISDWQVVEAAGHEIIFPYGEYRLLVYSDGEFISLPAAFELGLVCAYDVLEIMYCVNPWN